jgi:RimJ/RimL family protein N-acetyltransferase
MRGEPDDPAPGPVVDSAPAVAPGRSTMRGRVVTIVPLDPARHAGSLYAGTQGADADRLWRFMHDGPFPDRAAFDSALDRKRQSADPLYFAIVDVASDRAVGIAAYLNINPPNRVIEVGGLVYTPALQRTAGATEAMYLMARHAFDDLNYRRYEWKCNALNLASRRAAERLGFTFEGIFRQHMIVKGRSRDTAWFSMIDGEWPRLRRALEAWLDPSNFDAGGRQRRRLADLRRELAAAAT